MGVGARFFFQIKGKLNSIYLNLKVSCHEGNFWKRGFDFLLCVCTWCLRNLKQKRVHRLHFTITTQRNLKNISCYPRYLNASCSYKSASISSSSYFPQFKITLFVTFQKLTSEVLNALPCQIKLNHIKLKGCTKQI